MSLPDYEDYYSYDYHTGQYSEDSYTTTLGYYDYQGYTDNPFKIGGDTNEDEVNSAFNEQVTENEETIDFFPVKDVFKNMAMGQEDEEDVLKEKESGEVDIVSLQDTSEEDESNTSLDSTLHYEIISNNVYPIEDANEHNDSLEETDDVKNSLNGAAINFFPSDHVLLIAMPENITETADTEVAVEEGSSLENITLDQEDLFDSSGDISADIADITTIPPDYDIESVTDITENTEAAEFESVTNSIAKDMGSGLELPEEALNTHVEQIIGEGSAETDDTMDTVIKEGFEITTNVVDYLFEESGSGDIELSELKPDENVSNIKSVKVKVNVKSAEHLNADYNVAENKSQSLGEFASDITKHNESGAKELKVFSKDKAVLSSHSGSEVFK